jgi:hypothetical protein
MFPKKKKKFGHCKNQNKSEKQQKQFYVEKMVATCSLEWVKVIYGFHGLHGLHGLVVNL